MNLIIVQEGKDRISFEVDTSMEIENLMALLESEVENFGNGVFFKGRRLESSTSTLSEAGLYDGAVLEIGNAGNDSSDSSDQASLTQDGVNRSIAAATSRHVGDFGGYSGISTMEHISEDPFDVEAQKKIEKMIMERNILQNMKDALEHNPESYGTVVMLYVNLEANGHPIKAFVDSGAQSTIISYKCAERCHLMHLVDKRFSGIARGVGTAKIVGRIHSTQLKIGNQYILASLIVLEEPNVDFLFGLDLLRKYHASIDLAKNSLIINDELIPFLPEHQVPKPFFGPGSDNEEGIKANDLPRAGAGSTSIKRPPLAAPRPTSSISEIAATNNTATQYHRPIASADMNANNTVSRQPPPLPPLPASLLPDAVDNSKTVSSAQLRQLESMGVSSEQARVALETSGGDFNAALAYLFD